MDIYYTNETLYVKMKDITTSAMNIMQRRVFRIIEDYDIDNIVINTNDPHSDLFIPFVSAYRKKHHGNLRIL